MEYETDNVVAFEGPRMAPTPDDYKEIIECLENLLEKAKNEELMALSYAYVSGRDIGGRSAHTNWICLPGTNKHVMMASVRYLEHDMLMTAIGTADADV